MPAVQGHGFQRQGLAEIGVDQIDRLDVARLGLTGAAQLDWRHHPAWAWAATTLASAARRTLDTPSSRAEAA